MNTYLKSSKKLPEIPHFKNLTDETTTTMSPPKPIIYYLMNELTKLYNTSF